MNILSDFSLHNLFVNMAAVIRLKRHLSEEPIEALIINCKRQKRNDDDETDGKETKTVLKFAGTIKEQVRL